MIEIPVEIFEFAKRIAPALTPKKRASGWSELTTETRGTGDLMDLLGSLVLFEKIAKADKICKMDITCGVGDKSDLEVQVGNSFKKINIKTSSYAPFRDGLNLYVKQEEVDKDIDAYVQIFVHLDEQIPNTYDVLDILGQAAPHVHIAGWIPTTSKEWEEAKANPITIPRTDGHKGIKVPIEKLQPIGKMISIIDNKF